MASHPHLHHHSRLPSACCCTCNCEFSGHPSPLPPPTDPLLQAFASHILQSAQLQHSSRKFQSHYQFQPQNPLNQNRLRQQQFQEFIPHSALSSLLSRIEALESLIHRVSAPATDRFSYSLRDTAARTIQIHFRAFLVRRSRTLGQLKELAVIKSSLSLLESSLETSNDLNMLSRKAKSWLIDIDYFQGNDPLIREGKKSISRDLVRFLDQIDNIRARRQAVKNLRLNQSANKSRASNTKHEGFGNQKETIEKIRNRVEKLCELSKIYENGGEDLNLKRVSHVSDEESPRILIRNRNQTQNHHLVQLHKPQPSAKKTVRFAENGNLFSVLGASEQDGVMDESDSSDELVENTCSESETEEIEEIAEVAEDEEEVQRDGGSPETSDGERNPRRKMTHEAAAFSAPLPVKMEKKADLMKNRKSLKIIG